MIVDTPIICDRLSFISEYQCFNLHEYVNKMEPTLSSDDNNHSYILFCFANLEEYAKHKKEQ